MKGGGGVQLNMNYWPNGSSAIILSYQATKKQTQEVKAISINIFNYFIFCYPFYLFVSADICFTVQYYTIRDWFLNNFI